VNLWIGADRTVFYTGARDAVTQIVLATGTCSWTLKDSGGNSLGTGAMSDAVTGGDYYGTIDAALTTTLTEFAAYTVEITFAYMTYNDFRVLECIAVYRGATC
jgi:hypothetical protein